MKSSLVFVSLYWLAYGYSPVVKINQGLLKGSTMKTRNGRQFIAFQGIPYAQPPVKELRFKNPVAAGPWDGVLNATVERDMCIQKNLFMYQTYDELFGTEDCLYINVYTPTIPGNGETQPLPVMVWIAGGGFSAGSGGLSLYGPHYLLDKDVVVVSFNYRIGPLGFLSTEDGVLPGNYGMKDQVLALQWVKDNIDKFNGDPTKVTIFGESAGGVSVGLHLLSPMSKGLFQKAIMESGTPLCLWSVSPPGWARRRARALSTIAGCPEESGELAECLREKPAELLVDLFYNFFEWKVYPAITFMPVVENCDKGESFLCKYPLIDFEQQSNVPVLMGMNTEEGGLFAARMYDERGVFVDYQLKDDFNEYISSLLIYKYTVKFTDLPIVGNKIFERYYADGKFDDPSRAVKMVSGGVFLPAVINMATNLTSPVNFYVYGHQNQASLNAVYGPYPKPNKLGVTHGDEMTSLFYTTGQATLKGDDLAVSKLVVNLWTRFASNDKLTVDGSDDGDEWPLFDKNGMRYLSIDSGSPVVSERPFSEEYEFWNGLPLLSGVKKPEVVYRRSEL